jgi:hypothetical protein
MIRVLVLAVVGAISATGADPGGLPDLTMHLSGGSAQAEGSRSQEAESSSNSQKRVRAAAKDDNRAQVEYVPT